MSSLKSSTRNLSLALSGFYAKPVAKISLELFFSLGLVILLAVVAIKPTLTTIAQLNTEIEEKQDLLNKLRNKNAALQSANQQYIKEQTNIALLAQAMPPSPNLMGVLKTLEKMATDSRVLIKSISVQSIPVETDAPQANNQDGQKQDLPITLTVAGQYGDIRTFVETLDNSRRIFDVISISFSLDEGRGNRLLTAAISINAPYFGAVQ